MKPVYTDYAASTALIGTGLDLARFGQMLLNLGELNGVRILSEENARNVLQGGRLTVNKDGTVLGYGTKTWVDRGVELIGHGGGGPGFALQYMLVPDKALVIVVLANGTITDSFELAKLIASLPKFR
jgi:CubicO group peptidase (beta-lactamase class C family)